MTTVTVNASRSYNVRIGKGLLSSSGKMISEVTKAKKFALVTDDNVDKLYSERVISSIEAEGLSVCKFVFPHGEASKTADTLIKLYDFLAQNEITRSDAVIALGGGVTGDMAGFASATYLRGIDLIQLPTSLLAQIDSSVGGKTAIDLPAGKNLAGAFKQPSLVICDIEALDTLPDEYLEDGMGEAIKYGMIKDKELFDLFLNCRKTVTEEIIARCVSIKRDVVEADEFDKGERALLNFGHTIGHAIEKHGNFTSISHGKAVAIGMAVITKYAAENGICDAAVYDKLCRCLKENGLSCETDIPLAELLPLCLHDKKREDNEISLVLCSDIGKSLVKKMPLDDFFRFFKEEKGSL